MEAFGEVEMIPQEWILSHEPHCQQIISLRFCFFVESGETPVFGFFSLQLVMQVFETFFRAKCV